MSGMSQGRGAPPACGRAPRTPARFPLAQATGGGGGRGGIDSPHAPIRLSPDPPIHDPLIPRSTIFMSILRSPDPSIHAPAAATPRAPGAGVSAP
eukprot:6077390-Prymnesium_polylepis.1